MKPIIFSRSEIATWQTCQMRYYFQYILGWHARSEDLSDPIRLGNIGHGHMQRFFTAIKQGATKQEAYLHLEATGFTTEDLIALLLARKFCEEFDTESGKPLYVDDPVIVPATSLLDVEREPLYYGFAPDLVWQFHDGTSMLFDWKFTRRKWSQAQVEMDSQLPGYKYALNKFFNANIKHCRYVFFNTTSENTIGYKYGTFTPDMKECLAVLDNQLKEAYRMKERKYLPLEEVKSLTTRTVSGTNCQYCPYQFPCRLDRKGSDIDRTLKLMFTKESDYGYDNIEAITPDSGISL